MIIEPDEQLFDLNIGAQRRPPTLVAAPALIWQQGFWRPNQNSRQEWVAHVDRLLFGLFSTFRSRVNEYNSKRVIHPKAIILSPNITDGSDLHLFHHTTPAYSDKYNPRENDEILRHDSVTFSAKICNISVTVSAELHYEYWTLMLSADYSKFIYSEDEALFELLEAGKAINRLNRLICQRHNRKTRLSEDALKLQKTRYDFLCSNIQSVLLSGFRAWCNDFVLDSLPPSGVSFFNESGKYFCDFTTLALYLNYAEINEKKGTKLVAPPAATPTADRRISDEVKGANFTSDDALKIIDASWPIIKRFQVDNDQREREEKRLEMLEDEGADDIVIDTLTSAITTSSELISADRDENLLRKIGKPEYTASILQNGTVIFISSMGRQFKASMKEQSAAKTYILVVSYRSKWRLGRLVDRIMSLETTRLAAVRDLRIITDASRLLKEQIDKLTMLPSTPKSKSPSAIEIARNIYAASSRVPSSLEYRIEKSKYYAQRYQDLLAQMETLRITGFAEYKSYSQRRLMDAFDFIERVGDRYEYALRKAKDFIELEDAEKLSDIRQKHKDAALKTNHLLDNAELVIILPLSYYAAQVFSHLFEIESNKCVAEPMWGAYCSGIIFAIAVGLIIRFLKIKSGLRAFLLLLMAVLLAFSGAAVQYYCGARLRLY